MGIIHTIPAISEEASGPTYSVVRLCESLLQSGHLVTLATLDQPPIRPVPTFCRSFSLGLGPRRLGRSPDMGRWLDAQASAGEVSLLHNHSLWMMPNVYPGRIARDYPIPYIVSPRGTLSAWAMNSGSLVKRLFWPMVQRPSLTTVACFHATAQTEYEDIRRVGFVQPVAIVPNGIDVPPYMKRPSESTRTLLFLGRIHPVKGLDILLNAWQAVQRSFRDWRLRIVGGGDTEYFRKIRNLAVELRLERVEFSGPLYGVEKWAAYSEADLFVLPTHSENFGVSVAEALSAGTPAIVSHGAPWHGLNAKMAGWWIEKGLDPLVCCLETVMPQSRTTLFDMGRRGREWMLLEYSWKQIARQMAETYQWVLGKRDRPSWIIEH